MNHTEGLAILVENKQASDAVLLHHCDRFCGKRISRYTFGIPGHQLFGIVVENITFGFQAAPQVAVSSRIFVMDCSGGDRARTRRRGAR